LFGSKKVVSGNIPEPPKYKYKYQEKKMGKGKALGLDEEVRKSIDSMYLEHGGEESSDCDEEEDYMIAAGMHVVDRPDELFFSDS
jgi:hypothetical protein